MRHASIFAAALAAAGLAASAAGATTVQLDFDGQDHGRRNIGWSAAAGWPAPGESASGGASAGAFTMSHHGTTDSFVAWCIDLFDYISGGTPPVTNPIDYATSPSPIPTAALARLQSLFDAVYDTAVFETGVNHDASAAFQAAIWDSVYDTDGDVTTGSGTDFFKMTSGRAQVSTLANRYLADAAAYAGPKRFQLTLWNGQANDPDAQDLVSVHAMPVPAGIVLTASAFALAGWVRRRRAA